MEICKKINEIFKIYKEPIYIFGTLLILIGFFNYINFTNENFSLFIYSWLIIFITYFLLFRLTDVEIFLTRKITYIVILSISFILYSQKDLGLVNYDTLYILGAIIAFWYGYKRYERDKELEIIEKYNNKHKNIYTKFLISENNLEEEYSDIIEYWKEEFYLYNQGYINQYLWDRWSAKTGIILRLHPKILTYLHYSNMNQYSDFNLYLIGRLEFELSILKKIKEDNTTLIKGDPKEIEKFIKWSRNALKKIENLNN